VTSHLDNVVCICGSGIALISRPWRHFAAAPLPNTRRQARYTALHIIVCICLESDWVRIFTLHAYWRIYDFRRGQSPFPHFPFPSISSLPSSPKK